MAHSFAFNIIALGSFLLTSGLFLFAFRRGEIAHRFNQAALIGFAIGTACLTVLAATGHGHTALFFALAVSWLSIASWLIWKIELIGTFTSPIISLTLLVNSYFGNALPYDPSVLASDQVFLKLHVASALIGQAFAVAACGISLLLLWQERKLKSRDLLSLPGTFPAMDTLSVALSKSLWIGFFCITISLLTGAIVVRSIPSSMSIAPKALWAILVWFWYLTTLVLAHVLSYRPHRIARMSLAGFALLALSWFGMAFTWNWNGGL